MQSLNDLQWRRCCVTLRNTRNLFGRTPPLVAFEAIFKFAMQRSRFVAEDGWCFHPLDDAPGPRIRLNRPYRLAILFPQATSESIQRLTAGLGEHLANPANNFALERVESVEVRNLASLQGERPELEEAGDELCLDFLTPYQIRNPERGRPWHLSTEEFFKTLLARLRRIFGAMIPDPPSEAVAGLTVWPCYWHYEEHAHRSRSGSGDHYLKGWAGPLYFRGPIAPLLPWLRLAAELHAGDPATFGCAHPVLRLHRPHFDTALRNPQMWRSAYDELAAQITEPEPFFVPLTPATPGDEHSLSVARVSAALDEEDPSDQLEELEEAEEPVALNPVSQDDGPAEAADRSELPRPLAELMTAIRNGTWRPEAAAAFMRAKKSGGERLAVRLAAPDRLVHRVLQRLLTPVLDRVLEDTAYGFRAGRGVQDARRAIAQAWREGCTWVLETDIDAFFDSVDWSRLHAKLHRILPTADTWTRELIGWAMRTPVTRAGEPVPRSAGLLQGSPLSPILANLFLDEFDELAASRGLRVVRYADDFVVLCRSREEAERARGIVTEILIGLGLVLSPEKTALTPVEAGFTFLGTELGADIEEAVVEASALRKTLWVREPGAWLSLDADQLQVRAGSALLLGVPLARVGEIILVGAGGISSALARRCLELRIPLTFCAPTGHYAGTLRPDSRAAWELGGRHLSRREALDEAQAKVAGALWVEAKLGNYLAWMKEYPGAPTDVVGDSLSAIPTQPSLESLRGVEGIATRTIFRWVNERALDPAWRSERRDPGKQPDRWNSLLDFGYFLLFTRINVLLRTRGLNPYLGFLHSPTDHFESLVCDLQEPFRARVDRWALTLANRGVVKPADFEPPMGRRGWRMNRDTTRRVVEAWEREQYLRRAGDPGTLGQILAAQVDAVVEWARNGAVLQVYRHPEGK
ncbi:MAG TPA: CRISPR-associated endonuclease Cas1 [Verrucomicrobiota bacterium]|nr:CRISPR-associated endonuclease Cas1 [Verrucomicrobiota bacterium]